MILTIIGARPQFVKASVVSRALKDSDIPETIIHTGQHYDDKMSSVFWEELKIPAPAVNLNVGSGTHGKQTAKMIEEIEAYILSLSTVPKAVLLYGDTNSTLAGAIVASKLHIPVIHVEAGLISFNNKMPEEINRIVTDRISDFLFCSSENPVLQLEKEGITKNVYNVGDVMYDAVMIFGKIANRKLQLNEIIPYEAGHYNVLTLHRPANTDDINVLKGIISAFEKIERPTVWPVHPRIKDLIDQLDLPENLKPFSPFSYLQMLTVMQNCNKVFTDSGGLQKEAYWMNKDCITIREETEWIETLNNNHNILTGSDPRKIIEAYSKTINTERPKLYGNGDASQQIARIIKQMYY